MVRQVNALVEVGVLHEVKHDVALRRGRVEASVGRLIVALQEHSLVLAHRYAEVIGELGDAEDVGLGAVDALGGGAIDVDAEHHRGLVAVGEVRTLL